MRLNIWVISMPIANGLCASTVHIVHTESNLLAVVYYIVCAYICLCLFVFVIEKLSFIQYFSFVELDIKI